jgi:hypothetical protein
MMKAEGLIRFLLDAGSFQNCEEKRIPSLETNKRNAASLALNQKSKTRLQYARTNKYGHSGEAGLTDSNKDLASNVYGYDPICP